MTKVLKRIMNFLIKNGKDNMKIENQTAFIGVIIGFALGLFAGWSTSVNKDTIVNQTEETYGYTVEPIDTVSYKNIDTIVMNYEWGKEKIYIYEYN